MPAPFATRAVAVSPALPAGLAPAAERRDATAGSRATARGRGATAGGDESPEEEQNSERRLFLLS